MFPTFGRHHTTTHLVAEKIDKNPTFHLGKWNLDRGNGQIAEMVCVWSFLYFFLDCVATTARNHRLVVGIFFNLYKGDSFPTEETENGKKNWNHPPQFLTLKKDKYFSTPSDASWNDISDKVEREWGSWVVVWCGKVNLRPCQYVKIR